MTDEQDQTDQDQTDQDQTDEEGAHADARAAVHEGTAALLEKTADRIGLHAGAKAVFGDAVERDGCTVIPVAQMMIGTGAGGGGSSEEGTGVGAGGGALTRPLGYIEVTADGAAFMPLKRPWADAPLVLAYTLLVLVVLRTLVRAIRG